MNIFKFIFPLIGMIRSASYPRKLTKEEEYDYLEKKKNGCNIARDKLIEHNLRLVAHIVKKFDNTNESKDDLLSIGSLGLIKAIDTYKHPSMTKLATYAARCIENEILMLLRSNKKNRNLTYLESAVGFDKEGQEILLMDYLKDDTVDIEDDHIISETITKLKVTLSILNKREKEIITRRFGLKNSKCETQKEIAYDLKISRSYVSRIEKRALMKLYLKMLE